MMRTTSPKRPQQHRRNPNHRRQHSKNYQGGEFNQNQNHNQIDLNALDADQRLDYRPPRNRTMLQQNVDKFLNQAREAMSSGDRSQSENYLQHADHFNRLLNEQKDIQKLNDVQRTQHREHIVQNAPIIDDIKEEQKENKPAKPLKKIDSDQLDIAVLPKAIETETLEKKQLVKKVVARRTPTPRKKTVANEEKTEIKVIAKEPEAS
ncbi:MAG TPA: hypothetical protein DIC42_03095 [Holosporales bacterium]|nr:hypothetical protein [Holosporales bacterium]